MRYSISTFVTLAASVAALEVTYPTEGADINLSKDVTIKWTSVSSDPTSFAIHLVNENTYPNVDDVVASDVNTSAGSYTMKGISAADGSGYQINLISTSSENSGILAQSEQFNVTGSSSSSTTASTSSSTASGKSSSTGTSTSTAATSSSASAPISTSTSVSVSTVSVSGSSTLGTSTSTKTASSTSGSSTSGANASSTESSSASSTANAAAALAVPAAGSLLSLLALVL